MVTRFLFGSKANELAKQTSLMTEVEFVLDQSFNTDLGLGDRRDASFSLKSLSERPEVDFCKAYTEALSQRTKELEKVCNENEDIAQAILDTLLYCCLNSPSACLLHALNPSSLILHSLLTICASSSFLWVRISSVECLKALLSTTTTAVATVDKLLTIPSALETLMNILTESEQEPKQVRNEMILLFLKLTEVSEQVRMFLLFCDGLKELLRIAVQEMEVGVVSGDCLAVCINALKNNAVGQRMFLDDSTYLSSLSTLLIFPSLPQGDAGSSSNFVDPTPYVLRLSKVLELIRLLLHVRYTEEVVLHQVQTKFGATPRFMEHLYLIVNSAKDNVMIEEATRREALYCLGDLIVMHSGNANKVERLGLFLLVVREAIHSARWADAKAYWFVWTSSLERQEQRSLALLGNALVEEDPALCPVSFLVSTLKDTRDLIFSLMDEIYVDPGRIELAHRVMFRTCRLWETLLGDSLSARELALRISVPGTNSSMFDLVCETLKFKCDKEPPELVQQLGVHLSDNVLRVLIIWLSLGQESAQHLLSEASNLFFFEPTVHAQNDLFPLVVACCLHVPTAFGLIENKLGGVERFLASLSQWKQHRRLGTEIFSWQDDASCLSVGILDRFLFDIGTRLVKEANALLVQGSSSSSHTLPPPERSARQKKHVAKLLLALTCQQVEIQSLLQSLQDLGGEKAKEDAQSRAKLLVQTLLKNNDTAS